MSSVPGSAWFCSVDAVTVIIYRCGALHGYYHHRVSVTHRYCVEADKDIIKLFYRSCSPTTMVF